ncbi:MAG: N-acetyltransferase [Thermoproteota archaeon]|nr:MAG: N-acetyltransferase [Candidatus Korarchaeota archaeon]
MKETDIDDMTKVYLDSFKGMRDPESVEKWIRCNFNAYPRMQYFVAEIDGRVVGYILWVEKGGFRKEAVLELEQIGVLRDYRGQGIGSKLIIKSLEEMKKYLMGRGSKLKLVEVTTGTSNQAQKLYIKTLNAKPECLIKDLFRGDELIMIARF